MRSRGTTGWLLIAIGQLAFADEAIHCCGSAFQRDLVIRAARDADRNLSAQVSTVFLFPEDKRTLFPIASSSHPDPKGCLDVSLRILWESDQAVLIRTALGSTLHLWRRAPKSYERIVLRGSDVFQVRIEDSRLVSLRTNHLGGVKLRIVRNELATPEESHKIAVQFMDLLKVKQATVYLGTEPFEWNDLCLQVGLPILWESAIVEEPIGERLRAPSIYCRVDSREPASANRQCVKVIAPK